MSKRVIDQIRGRTEPIGRRSFIASTAATAAAVMASNTVRGQSADSAAPGRKVKLGVVGCGGRGKWIAGLFQ